MALVRREVSRRESRLAKIGQHRPFPRLEHLYDVGQSARWDCTVWTMAGGRRPGTAGWLGAATPRRQRLEALRLTRVTISRSLASSLPGAGRRKRRRGPSARDSRLATSAIENPHFPLERPSWAQFSRSIVAKNSPTLRSRSSSDATLPCLQPERGHPRYRRRGSGPCSRSSYGRAKSARRVGFLSACR
jgi:hypothetical protein